MHAPSTRTRHSGLRKLFPLLAILLSLLVTAMVGEGVLRLAEYSRFDVNPQKSIHEFDPVLGWRGKRLYTARFKNRRDYDVVIANDAAGFRKQVNLEAKLSKAPHHIFVFGDSFVWGYGVGQGEVFTDKMNLMLPNYSVHNYGITGIGTVVEYLLFSTEVNKLLQPDAVVILMFCNNDFGDNVERKNVHAEVANGEVKVVNPGKPLATPVKDWIKSHSYLCNFVWYRIDLYRGMRANRKQEDEAQGRAITESDERFAVTRYFLAKFQADCEAAKARFILVHIPCQEELSECNVSWPYNLANEKARAEALFSITRTLHIETIDLLPGFLARKNKTGERLTFKNDPHWNRCGNQTAAELLSEYLSSHPAILPVK